MGWMWVLWVLGWIAAIDCLRRPHIQWLAADREKTFWVVMLIAFGPLTVWIYLIGVLPKLLAAASTSDGDSQFRKKW